jgi:hypothetical protein
MSEPTPITSSTRVVTSGLLAIILWLGTATVIGSHLYTVVDLSHKLSQVKAGTGSSKEEVDNFEKSIASVESTAKTLYSFLTPFAAAVTGFFFSEVTSTKSKSSGGGEGS